mgnify:CR=1 FL=1
MHLDPAQPRGAWWRRLTRPPPYRSPTQIKKPLRSIAVADPYVPNPVGAGHKYWVHIDRVIGAILLGVMTYDASLLILEREK